MWDPNQGVSNVFFFALCMHLWNFYYAFRITVSCETWMSICWQVTFTKETRDLQTTKFKIASKNLEPISSKSASHPFCICYFTRYNFLFPLLHLTDESFSFIGVESFLFVSSVYRDPLVYPDVLEVCCHHSHYLGHLRHRLRLGNTTSIKFDNFTDNLLKFLHIAKPKSTRQNEIGIASYGRS